MESIGLPISLALAVLVVVYLVFVISHPEEF